MSDSPEAIQLKIAKTIPALQQMLNTMCTTTIATPSSTDPSHNRQQLSQQLIPPTAVSDQSASMPLTNQMMDIILQLQNQVQQIQSQAAQRASEEQQQEERNTTKQKKRKHPATKKLRPDDNTTAESAAAHDTDAEVQGNTNEASTSKPKRKKQKHTPVVVENADEHSGKP